METIWFCLVALILAGYVVLDGFDLGAGALHLWVARSNAERRAVLRSIGPVWDGNEVWLIAGGGTLYFAFPKLYASSFSGFYLPLMMVLWLLILRGISIEFRNHIESPVWQPLWDAVFSGASLLLVIFFGAALGNVVRGVPLDREAGFFLPLWTDFRPGPDPGILDWYTIMVAVVALVTLVIHGGLWLVVKTEGALQQRARTAAHRLWLALVPLIVILTITSFAVQPQLHQSFAAHPWGYVFPALALAALAGMRMAAGMRAFLSSGVFVAAMLCSVAFGLYPYVLPSNSDPTLSLTAFNSAAAPYGLRIGLVWFIPGMLLALGYFFFVYRSFAGKVRMDEEGY